MIPSSPIRDVAGLVALRLEVPERQELPEVSAIIGDKIWQDELFHLAEDVTDEGIRYHCL